MPTVVFVFYLTNARSLSCEISPDIQGAVCC